MKVLLVNGSPHREGNTFLALSEVARTLQAEGIDTEIVSIGAKPVRGCIGCWKCAELGHCVFEDDLYVEIRGKLASADGLIVGSPVYFAGPNGSLCALLDRLFVSCVDRLNKYFTILNMPVVSSSYWNSVHGRVPGEVLQDAEGLQTMRVLGRNMARMLEAGLLASEHRPETEPRLTTNFIR